jgi:hypothetical protein
VGNGNNDVGSATPTRKPGQPVVDNLSGSNGSGQRIDPSLKTGRLGKAQGKSQGKPQGKPQEKTSEHPASLCGAMSQQGSEFLGNVSAPQKFVQLVGCRDRKAGPGLEGRQYSNPVKR